MADVRTLAIDETHVYVNTTGVHDETVGHRLGFVPLHYLTNARLEGMRTRAKCTCGSACPLCEVPLVVHFAARPTSVHSAHSAHAATHASVLDATHAASSGLVAMTSKHIRRTADAPVKTSHLAGMGHRILQAVPGSQFTALCKARVGTAADGAKWSAVSNCAFREVTCQPSQTSQTSQTSQPHLRNVPVDAAANVPNAAANVPNAAANVPKFLFTVETTGQMSPADVLHSALASLRCRLDPAMS